VIRVELCNSDFLVLAPIPTDHLTVEDVPKLMSQTRDVMIEGLKEISDEKQQQQQRHSSERLGTPKAQRVAEPVSVGSTTSDEGERVLEGTPTPTTTGSRTEGSVAGTETSEEDAVLVDRP